MTQLKGGTQWEQPHILTYDTSFSQLQRKAYGSLATQSDTHTFCPRHHISNVWGQNMSCSRLEDKTVPQPRSSSLWRTVSSQGAQLLPVSFPPLVLASAPAFGKIKGLALHSEKGTSTDRSTLPPGLFLNKILKLKPGCVLSVMQVLAISFLSLVGSALVCLCPELIFGNVCS